MLIQRCLFSFKLEFSLSKLVFSDRWVGKDE